ncbi:DUF2927 domain-containing protein [Afifella sp. IM 167]|uniref:DUF2927 domain-containing protein n=1 Tax=Afifella sp. IM 167 TaxID=2033586 RepID=UPI001CCF0FF0|nr:DUF2927 domain-containing protein [Afifella sp. IM 167]MBZ8133499.1 hypothetical protein [Afifella sp. IM 167]
MTLAATGRYTALILAGLLLPLLATAGTASALTDRQLSESFRKAVLGAEYASWGYDARVVKKFSGPVRVYIDNLSRYDRRREVMAFVASLPRQISGLRLVTARQRWQANYRIHVVDRAQYAPLVRAIYRQPRMRAPGRCLVRVVNGAHGITGADAVIVADEGDYLFHRCLVEEVLQGLGPLNDDDTLADSVFNDTTRFTTFTRHDRMILNMLYDPRIRAGMNRREVERVLPAVLRDVRRRVR